MDSPAKIGTMPVAEFRRLGYLQELNRNYLHPLGIALSVSIDENGDETFDEIWDYRTDPEGLIYADDLLDEEALERADYVTMKFNELASNRLKHLGYIIQPIKIKGSDNE